MDTVKDIVEIIQIIIKPVVFIFAVYGAQHLLQQWLHKEKWSKDGKTCNRCGWRNS